MRDGWKEQAKKEEEREYLAHFLTSYETATGETFNRIEPCETPDFIAQDKDGNTIGLELARIKFDPEDMHWGRVLSRREWADDMDAYFMLLRLLHQKQQSLSRGAWLRCQRKLLVIILLDYPLERMTVATDTDMPDDTTFDEVWLCDGTQIEIYGGVDLFPIVHPTLRGLFNVASRDRKPWG